MKLFLTSHSLSNPTLVKEFYKLVGQPAKKTSIAFIPTAMNMTFGDKKWFATELSMISKTNPKSLDIVDISALPINIINERLKNADVLFFSGGNSTHILHWLHKTGLYKKMPALLQNKVYAGISAGSIITNPTLYFSNIKKRKTYKKLFGVSYDDKTLNLVNFYIRPHLNTPNLEHASEKYIREKAKEVNLPVYGIDDNTAIVVNNNDVKIVGEGKWIKI